MVKTLGVVLSLILSVPAIARDDGRYAQSPLKSWFDSLKSRDGIPCCSDADGESDPQWDVKDGKFRVFLKGGWVEVPEESLVLVPNKFGRAVVWPHFGLNGEVRIRCFMPGAGT